MSNCESCIHTRILNAILKVFHEKLGVFVNTQDDVWLECNKCHVVADIYTCVVNEVNDAG